MEADALSDGERKLLTIHHAQGTQMLALTRSSIVLMGEKHRIFTFYDLRSELERTELESYNRLISILTHEIMNSVTPVSSLSETIVGLLEKEDGTVRTPEELSTEDIEDLAHSVRTIHRRSKGMLRFVQEYRKVYSEFLYYAFFRAVFFHKARFKPMFHLTIKTNLLNPS